MKVTFARHGIPDIVHGDNGPCYSSQEFADFKTKWGFKHVTSSPHFPSSNHIDQHHLTTISYQLSYWWEGHLIKTDLPVVENQLNVKHSKAVVAWKTKKKEIQKVYHDREAKSLPPLKQSEMVRIYDQKKLMWGEKATVNEKIAPRSYIVETKDKVQYRRNRKQLSKITSEVEDGNDKNASTTSNKSRQSRYPEMKYQETDQDM
ncbi:Retrotransposable element Tf2 type 1, partial [Paramuricea clavata]